MLGPGDAQLAEFDGAGNWKHTNVFGGGKLLATYDALGTHFHLNDWLGTARLQVGVSGAIDETCISLPFGDGLTCSGPVSEATEHHFTGKEHDAETGLDYFGARYFQDTSGRWMSPDWAAKAEPIPYAKMDNPQSLDLYAYVDNNPLSVADPDGHDPPPATCEATSGSCAATGAKANEHKKKTVTSHTTAQQQMAGGPPSLPAPTMPKVIPAYRLSYSTLMGGPGSHNWELEFHVDPPPPVRSYIVQRIVDTDPNGKQSPPFWEAFEVPANSTSTIYHGTGPGILANTDDMFTNFNSGTTVNADAGFYPGLQLPSSFVKENKATHAGEIPSTTQDPNLGSVPPAATVTRTFTFP